MAYKRISRSRKRELEEPDEFVTVSRQMVNYVLNHSKQIIIGVAAVFVMVLIVSGLKYYSIQKEKAAQAQLEQLLDKYEVSKNQTEPKDLYLNLGPSFESFLEKYPEKDAAKIARLIYAGICFNAKEYETAANLYTRSLKDYKDRLFYRSLIRKNLAYSYEKQKNYTQAINQMQKVVEQTQVNMKDEVLFYLGRLYAANDQKGKQTENFKKIIAEFPNSDYAQIAREKLNF